MSEGRTPEATLAQQRQLSEDDVSILHEIVLRAQDEGLEGHPRDALLNAFDQVFKKRHVSRRHDQACFNIILQLLDPNVPGNSLYDKFERVLLDLGIELSFEADEDTSQKSDATEEPKHAAQVQSEPEQTPPQIAYFMQQAEQYDRRVLARQTLEALRGFMSARQATRRAVQQAQKEVALSTQADEFYEDRLKRKVLKQMVAIYEDRRTTNAHADRYYEGRLLRRVAGKTMDAYRVRRVQDMDEERLKGRSLYMWTLATREAQFQGTQRQKLVARYLAKVVDCGRGSLTKSAFLEHIFKQRDQQQRDALVSAALGMLAQKSGDVQTMTLRAEKNNNDGLVRSAVYTWRSRISTVDGMNAAADGVLVQKFLRKLHSAALFKRDRETWLVTWTLIRWRAFLNKRRHQRLEESYRQARRMVKMNLARRMLQTWHSRAGTIRTTTAQAIQHYNSSILHRIIHPAIEHIYDKCNLHARLAIQADLTATRSLQRRGLLALTSQAQHFDQMTQSADQLFDNKIQRVAYKSLRTLQFKTFEAQQRQASADAFRARHDRSLLRHTVSRMRVALLQQRNSDSNSNSNNYSVMDNSNDIHKSSRDASNIFNHNSHLQSTSKIAIPTAISAATAITPARRKNELLLDSSTPLSTTPAYTPFAARLRAEPRIFDIAEEERSESEVDSENEVENDMRDGDGDAGRVIAG